MARTRHELGLEENNQETDNKKQAAEEWRARGKSGASIARTFIGVSSTILGSTGDGVLGHLAGESRVRGSLNVEVSGGEAQALADGLEGKFGDVLQSGVKGISNGKFDSSKMDIVLENNEPGRCNRQLRKIVAEKQEYIYPVSKREAFPRIPWKVLKDCAPVTMPAATCQSLVSNLPAEGVLDHMMGTRPKAKEMARTRSSADAEIKSILGSESTYVAGNIPMSPWGGRMVVGVTPRTFLMASRVKASSATICSLVRVVRSL